MISGDNDDFSFSPVNTYLRNPLRILNHMTLIALKLKQGRKWSLVSADNGKDKDKHLLVMDVLSKLAANTIEIPEALNEITIINDCSGARNDIEFSLLECYPTGLLEFHVTDRCDLDCIDCHYRNKVNATIPFNNIAQIARRLKPAAITITGGGEPTVYADKGKHLSDVVFEVRHILPETKLGLINNNTFIPRGEWANEIEWQRSSLDAASAETYFKIKRKDLFDTVVRNIKKLLLETSIPHVGVGFLFRKENAHDIHIFLCYWHRWLSAQTAKIQQRFNIQFRPISPAIDDILSMKTIDSFPDKITIETVEAQVELTHKNMENDASFAEFVRNRTNFNTCFCSQADSRGLFVHHPVSFQRLFSQSFPCKWR